MTAPEAPAKGRREQHKARRPLAGAWSKHCFSAFESQAAQVGGLSGSRTDARTRHFKFHHGHLRPCIGSFALKFSLGQYG